MEKPIKQEHMKYVALVYVFIILMGIGIIVISYNAGQEKEKLPPIPNRLGQIFSTYFRESKKVLSYESMKIFRNLFSIGTTKTWPFQFRLSQQ